MYINLRPVLIFCCGLFFITACQKSGTEAPTENSTELTQHSNDHNQFSTDMESTDLEITEAVESNVAFTGRSSTASSITALCNATVTMDSTATLRRMTITFNGTNCVGTHTRTGTVLLTMPLGVRWKDAGATITTTITNLKITRLVDGKSITVNGNRALTNVSGGRLIDLSSLPSITHTVTSNNMSVAFDDGTVRQWQVARKRVFTYNSGIVLTVTGTHTIGSQAGVAEWGVNRFGASFVSAITAPVVVRQDCAFRITSGQITHSVSGATGKVTFGLNAAGAATSCPGTGTYFMKLEWTGPAGNTFSTIVPY